MECVFVYGTLRCPSCVEGIIGRAPERIADRLTGFRRSKIRLGKALYPIIYRDADGEVDGEVDGFRLLVTARELVLLDEYETDAYQRSRVTLETGEEAWVYHG